MCLLARCEWLKCVSLGNLKIMTDAQACKSIGVNDLFELRDREWKREESRSGWWKGRVESEVMMQRIVSEKCWLIRTCFGSVLTRMRGFGAWLVGLDVSPEAVLISNVANLPEHSVLVLVAVAALHLMGRVALLLFPLFVALVVDDFVAVLVRVELVVLVILVVLYKLVVVICRKPMIWLTSLCGESVKLSFSWLVFTPCNWLALRIFSTHLSDSSELASA